MDINYLLKREQIALMQAARARTVEARICYEGLARGYRTRLLTVAFPGATLPARARQLAGRRAR